ncbi:hypothetical protein BKA61DRAFT_621616 [Leptodontidium sp. MPI-SDFR-AT-0119]|nr:hypothetical protein BKA61DRAFT_621616 [Leptodontidium sp. MPI-SDFR-AT-0119]
MSIGNQPPSPPYATPPGSFTKDKDTDTVLTPPPTNEKSTSTGLRIIEKIKQLKSRRDGGSGGGEGGAGDRRAISVPWATYKLDTEGYRDLQRRIQRDKALAVFVEHKLRYDYFPFLNRFILRMPGDTHEHFTQRIAKEIQRQLDAFEGSSAEFARSITNCGSSRVVSQVPGCGSHDPDASFKCRGAQFPGVVIEVSHSQKKRALPYLADDYILGSQSNIQRVVGLDIEYGGSKAKLATISTWVPSTTTDDGETALIALQTVKSQPFRDCDGNTVPSPDSDLRIPLQDFAPINLEGVPEGEIIISAQTMCDFLDAAEKEASTVKSNTGIVKPPATITWTKIKRRAATPPEELDERDEKRFCAEEDEFGEVQDDSSYKAPSVEEDSS